MQTATAEEKPADAPIRTATIKAQPIRLKPEQLDRLRRLRLELQAKFGIETDDNTLLQQFFDEAIDGWGRDKLSPKKAKAEK